MSGNTNVSIVGTTLCQYADSIYRDVQLVCTLLENMRQQPTRSFNALFACCAGAKLLAAGSYAGPVGLVLGGREIYNLSRQPKPNNLHQILSGIHVKVETIGTLAENQEKHLDNIETKLASIKRDVDGLEENLSAIRSMNELGMQELHDGQLKAESCNRGAMAVYQKAEEIFIQAKNASLEARKNFELSTERFTELLTLIQSDHPDLLLVKEKAEQALAFSKKGQELLCFSEQAFTQAFTAFQEANALRVQALSESFVVMQAVQQVMEFTREKAAFKANFNRQFAEIQKELQEARVEIQDILLLVNDLRQRLIAADIAVRSKLDGWDLLAGLVTAVCAVSLFSPLTAIGTGAGAAYGVHYSDYLCNLATRANDYVCGKAPPPVVALRKNELVRAEFDAISSSFIGARIHGRPSHKVGTLYLDIGDSIDALPLRFNVENPQCISELDLWNLHHLLTQKVENRQITPQRCLEIIKRLSEVIVIKSADNRDKPVVILPANDILFKRLETFCRKQIFTQKT